MLELIDLALNESALRQIDEKSGATDANEFARFLQRARELGTIRSKVRIDFAAATPLDLWTPMATSPGRDVARRPV